MYLASSARGFGSSTLTTGTAIRWSGAGRELVASVAQHVHPLALGGTIDDERDDTEAWTALRRQLTTALRGQ